jgi:hypothetical protein
MRNIICALLALVLLSVEAQRVMADVTDRWWVDSPADGIYWRVTEGGQMSGGNFTATNVVTSRYSCAPTAINAVNYAISTTAPNSFYTVVNGNAQNVTLPNPASWNGLEIVIADAAGKAASNTIAVNSTNTTGAGNINGAASVNISTAYGQRVYKSNGTAWFAR